jgi:hypothetical protein
VQKLRQAIPLDAQCIWIIWLLTQGDVGKV